MPTALRGCVDTTFDPQAANNPEPAEIFPGFLTVLSTHCD